MKLSQIGLAFILILPSTIALTVPHRVNVTTKATTTPPSTVTPAPPSRYYLQTRVKGHGNADKDGLYVSGYHTGAGENDVTLESIDVASVGSLNGTNQQFDYGDTFPWGMVMDTYDDYAGKSRRSTHDSQQRMC